MGLYFSHGTAHWAYRYFREFRIRLAKEIGADLHRMQGYFDNVDVLSWETIDDPIVYLLNHSDCDGDLSPLECEVVASRLRTLIQSWNANDLDKQQALLLVEGMETAAQSNELFIFC